MENRQIHFFDLNPPVNVYPLMMDVDLGSFHTFFLLNIGLVLENLEGDSLSLVELEPFHLED